MKDLGLNRRKTYKKRFDPETKQEAPNIGFIIFLFVVFISAYVYFSNFYFA